jgi:hypothetical protein
VGLRRSPHFARSTGYRGITKGMIWRENLGDKIWIRDTTILGMGTAITVCVCLRERVYSTGLRLMICLGPERLEARWPRSFRGKAAKNCYGPEAGPTSDEPTSEIGWAILCEANQREPKRSRDLLCTVDVRATGLQRNFFPFFDGLMVHKLLMYLKLKYQGLCRTFVELR